MSYNIAEIVTTIESSRSTAEAARKLGISRELLRYRLRKNGLKVVKDTILKVVDSV